MEINDILQNLLLRENNIRRYYLLQNIIQTQGNVGFPDMTNPYLQERGLKNYRLIFARVRVSEVKNGFTFRNF